MKVHNFLPHLLEALKHWKKRPRENEFAVYLAPLEPLLRPMLDDFGARWHGGLFEVMKGLNWDAYRTEALLIDPEKEEARLRGHLHAVESLLGIKLEGETLLFGAFTAMDGYARFDRGSHRVYLGVDESHGRGAYLDILITHELTHVAREPLPSVWKGFGLSPHMTHDEFTEQLPVIEHLMGEGFSCVVSELLNPKEKPWHYAYQTKDTLARVLAHGPTVDQVIHAELSSAAGRYGNLYDCSRYVPEVPRYAHYVWAWLWCKHLLKNHFGGEAKKMLHASAKELIPDALKFKLPSAL